MAVGHKMGCNYIGFIQKDKATELQKSPISVTKGFAQSYVGQSHWRQMVNDYADDNNEPHPEGFVVLSSWHSSFFHYFKASDAGVYQATRTYPKHSRLSDGTETIELSFEKTTLLPGPAIIAFGLTDCVESVENSPKSCVYGLANPGPFPDHMDNWKWVDDRRKMSDQFGEPGIDLQGLNVFLANEPGETVYYIVGGNCIRKISLIKETRNKTILALPTSETEKNDYLLRLRLKELRKNKKLKETAQQFELQTYQLQDYIRGQHLDTRTRQRLYKLIKA